MCHATLSCLTKTVILIASDALSNLTALEARSIHSCHAARNFLTACVCELRVCERMLTSVVGLGDVPLAPCFHMTF